MAPADGEGEGWDERLTSQERDAWQRLARLRRYTYGEVLLYEGEPARSVLLIERGLIKAVTTSAGGGSLVLALRGPGEVLGEIAALDGGGHSATVTALGEVHAHAIPAYPSGKNSPGAGTPTRRPWGSLACRSARSGAG